ncbi:hypothetical protein BGX28_001749, partial [Mortierella sp. GBA30]
SVTIAIGPTDNGIVTTTATSRSTLDQIKRHINYYHVLAEDGKGNDTLEPPYAVPPVNGITAQRVNKLSRMIDTRERRQRRVKHQNAETEAAYQGVSTREANMAACRTTEQILRAREAWSRYSKQIQDFENSRQALRDRHTRWIWTKRVYSKLSSMEKDFIKQA